MVILICNTHHLPHEFPLSLTFLPTTTAGALDPSPQPTSFPTDSSLPPTDSTPSTQPMPIIIGAVVAATVVILVITSLVVIVVLVKFRHRRFGTRKEHLENPTYQGNYVRSSVGRPSCC